MENVINLNSKHPDHLLEVASDELSEYVVNQSANGVSIESLIGLLDIFKTSLTLELLDSSE